MKKRTKRWLGGLALAAGALGAVGTYLTRNKKMKASDRRSSNQPGNVWARPGMMVTFRAELMPGREREQRTFRVREVLSNGRVLLYGVDGEHAEKEFVPVR
jgi:hypothetical protein